MDNIELAFAGAAEQARMLATGAVTAPKLAELYLDRINRLDPELRAYRTVFADQARAEAAAAGPAPANAPSQSVILGAAAPGLAPAPGLEAPSAQPSSAPVIAPGLAAAPGLAPASSVMMAPAPGPAGQPVVNLALTLNGPGLTDLSPAGKAAIQQALAKQLNLGALTISLHPSACMPSI